MQDTIFDRPTKIGFNVRPIKYAYFIREDDSEAFCRVVRLICTQWGGIYSLIIPIKQNYTWAPIYEDFLTLHEQDKFISFVDSIDNIEAINQIQNYIRRLFPNRRITVERGEFFEKRDLTLHVLRSIPNEKN